LVDIFCILLGIFKYSLILSPVCVCVLVRYYNPVPHRGEAWTTRWTLSQRLGHLLRAVQAIWWRRRESSVM